MSLGVAQVRGIYQKRFNAISQYNDPPNINYIETTSFSHFSELF